MYERRAVLLMYVLLAYVVCLSLMLIICDRVGLVSSKVSTQTVSLGSSLFGEWRPNVVSLVQGPHPQYRDGIGVGSLFVAENCNISETGLDRTKIVNCYRSLIASCMRAFDWYQG